MIQETTQNQNKGLLQQLSQQKALQVKQYYQQFSHFMTQEQNKFNTQDDQVYYIVSTKFLKQLQQYCLSVKKYRHLPQTMNQDLINPSNGKLKQGLIEKSDFEFVNQKVYFKLKEYWGKQFKRYKITIGNQKRIPFYLNQYKYIIVTTGELEKIDYKKKTREDLKLKIIQDSENSTAEELAKKIGEKNSYGKYHQIRLWRIQAKDNLDILYQHLKVCANKASRQYRIKGFGKRVDPSTKIQDLQLEQEDYFMVQIKQAGRKWFLMNENEKRCEGCGDYCQLNFKCKCQNVAYCTQACRQKDKRFHLRNCQYAQLEQLNKPIDMSFSKNSQKGVLGLRNLGNTCFMNSCLQCLSNTYPLTQYFLKSLFNKQINIVNPLGTKGKLAKTYAKFIKGMWCQDDNVFSPDQIKSAVSRINPMFSGYAQHDSQQFFSFLIDGLHQDLNRIQKKPYVESIDSNNRPQKQVALESWINHMKRNQSIITDLMTGQYRSRVCCPTCGKESITFDPFITVTLPIPQQVVNLFSGFFFHSNFQKKTKRINFYYIKPSYDEWMGKISNLLSINKQSFNIYLVSLYEGIYQVGRQSTAEILYKVQNQHKNIFVVELSEEEQAYQERIQITGRFSKAGYFKQYQNLWYKYPFYYQKSTTNGLKIYKKMLKFLFRQAYKDGKHRSLLYGGKTQAEYQQIMLQKRPFKLFLRYNRKIERSYTRVQFKFQSQKPIQDNMTLQQIIANLDIKECQLDVRFDKKYVDQFNFDKLKDFQQFGKKLQIPKQNTSDKTVQLYQCFQTLRQPQQLQAGNEWYCPKCKQHKQANKQMSIYKAPKILILHLKRFKSKGILRKQKNQTKVNFPLQLDLTDYVINPQPILEYNNNQKVKQVLIQPKYLQRQNQNTYQIKNSLRPIYDLYAISNHFGGLGGGHYTATAKNGQKWYDFNDSSVRSCSASSICGSGAYILFYKRRDHD